MSKSSSTNFPRIGVNAEFRAARKDAVALSWIDAGYTDSITAAGGLPIITPPLMDDEQLHQMLSELDGFVLTGCSLDLDPVRMGMDPHPASRPMPARREDFDRRLCKMLVEMRIPTLAIGAGMQMMNVVCGGTLTQHIGENDPEALMHRDPVERNLRHIIDIVPGTRIDQIYGPGEIRVNSHHHMAVHQTASLFRVSATCPDGIVEAYESVEDDWICLGVQWHPENGDASRLDLQVFEHFVTATAEQLAAETAEQSDHPATIPFSGRAAA